MLQFFLKKSDCKNMRLKPLNGRLSKKRNFLAKIIQKCFGGIKKCTTFAIANQK